MTASRVGWRWHCTSISLQYPARISAFTFYCLHRPAEGQRLILSGRRYGATAMSSTIGRIELEYAPQDVSIDNQSVTAPDEAIPNLTIRGPLDASKENYHDSPLRLTKRRCGSLTASCNLGLQFR